jgi:hypothetical protein
MQGFLAKTVKPPLLARSQTAAGMCIGLGNRRLQAAVLIQNGVLAGSGEIPNSSP